MVLWKTFHWITYSQTLFISNGTQNVVWTDYRAKFQRKTILARFIDRVTKTPWWIIKRKISTLINKLCFLKYGWKFAVSLLCYIKIDNKKKPLQHINLRDKPMAWNLKFHQNGNFGHHTASRGIYYPIADFRPLSFWHVTMHLIPKLLVLFSSRKMIFLNPVCHFYITKEGLGKHWDWRETN